MIGYAAGILLTVQFLPQLLRTIRTRTARDISMLMLVITLTSTILYEVYAYLLGLWPVIIMNGIFGLMLTTEIILKMRFDREGS